jgi:hypothetical protein
MSRERNSDSCKMFSSFLSTDTETVRAVGY